MVNSTEQSCRSNQDAFHTYILADCAALRDNAAGPKHEAIPISTWPGRRLPRVTISDRLFDAWSACTDTSRRCNESHASVWHIGGVSSRKVVVQPRYLRMLQLVVLTSPTLQNLQLRPSSSRNRLEEILFQDLQDLLLVHLSQVHGRLILRIVFTLLTNRFLLFLGSNGL